MQPLRKWLARTVHQPHHANLLDKRRAHVLGFQFFRINIFSPAQDDDFFLAPGDEQVAAFVLVAEVAAIEPAVADGFSRGVRAVVITLHDDVAADGDLPDGKTHVLCRLRIDDFDLYALQRLAHRAHHSCSRRRNGGAAAGLRKAIGLQHFESELFHVAPDFGIKRGTAGDEETHLWSQQLVYWTEKEFA